ncbi:MAG: hypothetical protein ACI9DJ_001118 [Algoriphagus sp.]|jgi:hypothetical protein
MIPEEDVLNLSPLTKLRKLRLKDWDLLHSKTVPIAIERGINRSN